MTKISLSLWNDCGAVAAIEDDDMNSVDIYLATDSQDATTACQVAAMRLRKLADAFDRLATMDDPFTSKAHRRAMKKPKAAND